MVEASMSSLDKSGTKDDPVINKKISDATKIFTITKVLSLVKGFDFSDFQSTVKDLQAHALKQEEKLVVWAKSSTNMAWNLSSRLFGLEQAQNHIQSSMSSFKQTLSLSTNVKGENEPNTATKDPPSYAEGSSTPQLSVTQAQPITIINPEPIVSQREGKGIATDEQAEDQKKLVKASSIVCPDLDALILVPYIINEKLPYLIAEKIKAHMDKEEKIKKAKEEARLLAINKPKVIKVIREEAKKLRIHLKEAITAKAVYRGFDGRTFDVHNPFAFGEFGIFELDELREIIPRKKNTVVKDLMNYLSQSDQAFQRWSDINKVGMEAIVSYLAADSMVQSPENERFSMKLKKLIAEHPDQEKLKSKKVKLEALGYETNCVLMIYILLSFVIDNKAL
uniref:Uncharacterized protein n=1 Tax=Tanacetum cinerariifolium TaxID=118510 RepID=A0A6L2MJ83_TANCI|nr:hypothetical protein [Tanacetum cinerariifolium]